MQFRILSRILSPWKVRKTVYIDTICISFHPWISRLIPLGELGFAVSVNFPANVWEEILLEDQCCKYNGLDSSLTSPPEKTEVAFEILPDPI